MNTELSIEETNKLRVKLGLKPILVDGTNENHVPPPATTSDESENVSEIEKIIYKRQKSKNPTPSLHDDLSHADIVAGEIMTLKDTDILNDDQDELITESEILNNQLNKKIDNQKRQVFQNDDADDGDDDNGNKQEFFKIGETKVKLKVNNQFKAQRDLQKMQDIAAESNRQLVTFDDDDDDDNDNDDLLLNNNDFATKKKHKSSSKQPKFKKTKKKKSKHANLSKVALEEEDETEEPVNLNHHVSLLMAEDDDIFAGENELQSLLSIERRNANKNKEKGAKSEKKFQNGSINGKKRNFDQVLDNSDDENINNNGGLVVDATSEFLSNLKQNILDKSNTSNNKDIFDGGDDEVKITNEKGSLQRQSNKIKHLETTDYEKSNGQVEASSSNSNDNDDNDEDENAFDEPNFSTGLSATLDFLKRNSTLKITEESQRKNKQRLEQERLKNRLNLQKLNIDEGNGDVNQNGVTAAQYRTEKLIEKELRNYNPEINITYTDDNNNVLDRKEAYKYLSHKFHGKGPSKNKQAKLLKRKQQN